MGAEKEVPLISTFLHSLKARHVRNNSLPSVVLTPSPKIDLSCESRKAAYRRQIPESLKSIPINSKFILDSYQENNDLTRRKIPKCLSRQSSACRALTRASSSFKVNRNTSLCDRINANSKPNCNSLAPRSQKVVPTFLLNHDSKEQQIKTRRVDDEFEDDESLLTRRDIQKYKPSIINTNEETGFKKFKVLAKRCTKIIYKAKSSDNHE